MNRASWITSPASTRAVPHGGHDLVERHHDDLADAARHLVGRPQPEEQVGGRALARHRHRPLLRLSLPAVARPGQHQRPAAAAQRPSAGQQRVLLQHPRQRGVGDLQHVELAALGHAVRHVDVGEGDVDGRRAGDPAVCPRVEDERVVGTGGERERSADGRAAGLSWLLVLPGLEGGGQLDERGRRTRSASATRQAARSRGPTGLEAIGDVGALIATLVLLVIPRLLFKRCFQTMSGGNVQAIGNAPIPQSHKPLMILIYCKRT